MPAMIDQDTLNPAANNPAGGEPDEFNESAPIQPGTEVAPNAPPEAPAAPTAPTPTPAIPDAPTDDGADSQAQTVADDAIRALAGESQGYAGSDHGGNTNPAQIIPDDEQDVVDHMQQMERSGQIDMDAFRGERNDDDESGMLGEGGMEPGDLDEHGNPARGSTEYTGME
jgi:hypothetical protein